MSVEARRSLGGIRSTAVLAVGAALLLGAWSARAGTKYLSDGALQNSRGGWDLPKQGACPSDATAKTRPDCLARRFVAASSAACTALGPSGQYSWSTGVCNDLVNTTQAACNAAVDRYWNAGAGVCAIVMKGEDRNDVVCAMHGGTWVTSGACTGAWAMPARDDPAYGPEGLWSGSGTGDQCLRCHNNVTQYNGPRVRDTEDVIYMGHKNMSRPVDKTSFKPWGGPPFTCTGHPSIDNQEDCVHSGGTWDPTIYPSDDQGNVFTWSTNQITVGSTKYDLKWIYGDWLAALPRAIYTGPTLNNMSYSCGRCHTTGWTSDAGTTPNTKKRPEKDFPGITWNGTGTTGQVKLGGGVAGDANVMSSWDEWGITCSRCHYSAVNDESVAPTFTAPPGMSMHHNALTGPNNNSGVCTDSRWSSAPSGSTLEAVCTANGGTFLTACSVNPTPGVCTVAANTQAKCTAVAGATWVAAAAGWCSNAFFTDSASCTANAYTWTDGWCKTADAQSACTGGTGDGANTCRLNGTQASCQLAGASWLFPRCSVAGLCNKGVCSNTTYANQVDCEAAGELWTAVKSKSVCDAIGGQFAFATDVVRCDDAGGKWFGNNLNRGQTITKLCMDCHRQEASGLPQTNGTCSDPTKTTNGACVAAGGTWTDAGDGLPLLVGPYHSTVTFLSHPHGNQFLNSPHAGFSGKFSEIATGKWGTADAKYASGWMNMGEALNTGNGCTGCHDVHTSIVAGTKPFAETCNECHHVKNLERVLHPHGAGTPFEDVEHEPMEACVSCHMPGGVHMFRINTDPTYSTFPMPAAMAAATSASTAPDGAYSKAVWVDLDAACGQCHGGGASNVKTTGTVAAGSASLTVASAAGFAVGEKIRVVGAGAYYYDDIGQSGRYSDFDTYVKAVAGNVVTLAGNASKGVTNAAVEQNATTNGASYVAKATLATFAKGIHNDHPNAKFTAVKGANNLTVAVDASATKCRGSVANCESFDWNWGDYTEHGAAKTDTHAYAKAGTYTITLTVKDHETGTGTATQTFTATAIAGAPTVTGACTPVYSAWGVGCTVNVPSGGYQVVSVDFGDGTPGRSVSNPAAGPLAFTHTYAAPGNFAIRATVVAPNGMEAEATIGSMSQATFIAEMPSISGRVLSSDGTRPVGSARITISLDNVVVADTMSRDDGTYTTGPMKPGKYSITVTKAGHTFSSGFGPFAIGPSLAGQNLVASH